MSPHPLVEQRNRSERQLRSLLAGLPRPLLALIRSALHGDPASRATLMRVLMSLD